MPPLHETYQWIKALHLIAVISWMAGMLYLPRLFVYHCRVAPGSEASEMLKIMEIKLLRLIINPAMIAAWIFGLWLAFALNVFDGAANGYWFYAKLGLLALMQVVHAVLARCRRAFARDERPHSERFFRILNEVPAALMVGIVVVVVVKPF
ncbi:MAG: protoporphyrinogen oxidase HemJ [Pseudomonadota bacterium]|nr:protoporphyrinogen oxidase HemJ [Pseudomonadota bacterium]MDE3038346.1 protoporphyrinogen oxidase HemJ [Pseudomonadota bacterium]